jgi:uncharacterized membrane protein YeiH
VVLANSVGLPDWVGLVLGAGITFSLRGLALILDWRLPTWRGD